MRHNRGSYRGPGADDAGQSARAADNIDWKVVGPQDVKRRAQTGARLSAGALHAGLNDRYAAFVYQHG